jgi:hypothetical protein
VFGRTDFTFGTAKVYILQRPSLENSTLANFFAAIQWTVFCFVFERFRVQFCRPVTLNDTHVLPQSLEGNGGRASNYS